MPTISRTDLGELAYQTQGEGGPALLTMHGWAGSGAYFDAMLKQIPADEVYSIVFDLPGHGRSASPSGPYTLDLIADAVMAVADAAGADTFVLLGFSMSAKFAQYVTYRHPDRVLGQILVAGCPAGPLQLPAELVDDWCARAGDAGRLAEVSLSCATRPIPAHLLAAAGLDAALVPGSVLRQTVDLCATAAFADEITGSKALTLVVGGSGDWLFTPDTLRDAVVAPLARAQLALLDCGHEIPLEAPSELAELIRKFIEDLRPMAGANLQRRPMVTPQGQLP
jgi:pimeloyl-ACP methyl ester carboxylesterase